LGANQDSLNPSSGLCAFKLALTNTKIPITIFFMLLSIELFINTKLKIE
jgi:hypothetical protein